MSDTSNRMVVAKVLSANDIGNTGAHQAGMLIPKRPELLAFFPALRTDTRNPRVHLQFEDTAGTSWTFAYIYYNNKLFGGTRNEYRLTRMTKYMAAKRLEPGDRIVLTRESNRFSIAVERSGRNLVRAGVLQLGTGWMVISMGGH
jgi:hypothetical protein